MFFEDLFRYEIIIFAVLSLFYFGLIGYSKLCPNGNSYEKFEERNSEIINVYSIESENRDAESYILGYCSMNGTDYYMCNSNKAAKEYKFLSRQTTVYKKLKNNEQSYAEIITNGYNQIVEYKLYVPKDTTIKNVDYYKQ